MKVRTFLFALLIGLIAAAGQVAANPVEFTLDHRDIVVVDGDTIMVGTKVFVLFGIDAPELGQKCIHENEDESWPCGRQAALLLSKMISLESGPLKCETNSDPLERMKISCSEGARDLALSLVKEGAVSASAEAPFGYRLAEKAARRAHLGIWRDAFMSPAEWRTAMAAVGERERKTDDCPFIGQTRDGSKVVVVPPIGHPAEPIENPRVGDRIFCNDEEAIEAGWQLRSGGTDT